MLIEERLNAFIYIPENDDTAASGRAKQHATRPGAGRHEATLPSSAVLDDDFLYVSGQDLG